MSAVLLVDRPEGSLPAVPPGQFSDQLRLVARTATAGAQNIGNPALIGAEHGCDVLHLVPFTAQKPDSFGFDVVKLSGSVDLDLVQDHPRNGVLECSHGCPPFWLHRSRRFVRVDGFTRGRIVPAIRPQIRQYGTTYSGRKIFALKMRMENIFKVRAHAA